MIFYYSVGEFGDDYEYEVERSDCFEAVKDKFGLDDILSTYILDGYYEQESEDDKENLLECGFDGTFECIKTMTEKDKKELAEEIFELVEDDYEDFLKDEFEEEAIEQYESDLDWEQEKRSLDSWLGW